VDDLREHIFDMATGYLGCPPESEFQLGYLTCLTDLIRQFEIMCDPDKSHWFSRLEAMNVGHEPIFPFRAAQTVDDDGSVTRGEVAEIMLKTGLRISSFENNQDKSK